MHGLKDNLEPRYVGAAIANANNTDANSSRIDMADYESAMFITTITDCVNGGVATLKVEQNDADSDSGMTAVTDAQAQATSAGNDDMNGTTLIVEVRNPAKRYIQAVRVSATQNIAFGEIHVILNPRRKPAAEHSTVADSAYVSN